MKTSRRCAADSFVYLEKKSVDIYDDAWHMGYESDFAVNREAGYFEPKKRITSLDLQHGKVARQMKTLRLRMTLILMLITSLMS